MMQKGLSLVCSSGGTSRQPAVGRVVSKAATDSRSQSRKLKNSGAYGIQSWSVLHRNHDEKLLNLRMLQGLPLKKQQAYGTRNVFGPIKELGMHICSKRCSVGGAHQCGTGSSKSLSIRMMALAAHALRNEKERLTKKQPGHIIHFHQNRLDMANPDRNGLGDLGSLKI